MYKIIREEIAIYNVMRNVRRNMYMCKYFRNLRRKDIDDIISVALFFKGNNKFFPNFDDKDFNKEMRIRLTYLFKKNEDHTKVINMFKNIFITEISKYKEPEKLGKLYTSNTNFTYSYGNRSNIKIKYNKSLYNKLLETVKKEYRKWRFKILFVTLLRYQMSLKSQNHQLAVDYASENIINNIELFASPINRTMDTFCSAYPDIDRFYIGNLGSFFNYEFEPAKKYVMNPPFIETLMTIAIKRVLVFMDIVPNIEIFITIPIWDTDTLEKLGKEDIVINREYEPIDLIKNSKYLSSITKNKMLDHTYIDHFKEKKVSVTNTYYIVLKNY